MKTVKRSFLLGVEFTEMAMTNLFACLFIINKHTLFLLVNRAYYK